MADNNRLRTMGEDLSHIAAEIVALARQAAEGEPTHERSSKLTSAGLRRIISERRTRERMLPRGLFADPAWDMLLELTASRIENARVPVSSLCIASAVPPTTALRWIAVLEEKGMLQREFDTSDARRTFIALSDAGWRAMSHFFNTTIADCDASKLSA